jgi:hypothetical protein
MSEYKKSYYPIINVEIFMDEHIDYTFQERLKFGEYNLDDFSMGENFTQSLKNKIKEFIIEKLKDSNKKSLVDWSEF